MEALKTDNIYDTWEQMKRAYACFRTIAEQIFGAANKEREKKVKDYIMLDACEHNYPFTIEDGICKPMSLSKATKIEFNIVNTAINLFADQYYPQLGRPLYLWQEDTWGLYKSIGGRTRQEMWMEYPGL